VLTGGTLTDDIDSPSSLIELDFPIDEGINGEIVPDSDPATGMELRPDLPDDDISRSNRLSAIFFDTSPLSVGIPTVAAGPLSLFMRHCS
jgi:hypothetical protein